MAGPGEYYELEPLGPILEGLLPSDFDHGDKTEPLKLAKPDIQIIPLICLEDTVGRVARKFVRDQPQLIVNMTNDGWFLHSAQTEQHTANAAASGVPCGSRIGAATQWMPSSPSASDP